MNSKENCIEFIELLKSSSLKDVFKDTNVDVEQAIVDIDTFLKGVFSPKVKNELTENGKKVVGVLKDSEGGSLAAAAIAEELFIAQRSVVGIVRKLVSDGYVEKIGSAPIIYALTEKGKSLNL